MCHIAVPFLNAFWVPGSRRCHRNCLVPKMCFFPPDFTSNGSITAPDWVGHAREKWPVCWAHLHFLRRPGTAGHGVPGLLSLLIIRWVKGISSYRGCHSSLPVLQVPQLTGSPGELRLRGGRCAGGKSGHVCKGAKWIISGLRLQKRKGSLDFLEKVSGEKRVP